MKYLCLIVFTVISCTVLPAQTISGNFNFPAPEYSTSTLDQSKVVVYYDYLYSPNPQKKLKKKRALTALQIGDSHLKFVDFNRLSYDTLQRKFSKLKSIRAKQANEMIPIYMRIGLMKTVYVDLKQQEMTVQAILSGNRFEYHTPIPDFDWTLQAEQKTLLGHKVTKATMTYAGRHWVAWYAADLPMPYGPYVFGGLPGLIVELSDTAHNFQFTIKAIETKKVPIYKHKEANIKALEKNKYYRLERRMHENPSAFNQRTGGNKRSQPYNPLELIEA